MLSPHTLSKRAGLLALLPLLLLHGCGPDAVRFIAPPPERMAPVAAPEIPPATTPCSYNASQLCYTDEELARTVLGYDDALAKANGELEWLRTFFASVPTKPK
jgi:hypothetical protein